MQILHVTQCTAGGVPDAIETIARVSIENDHSVLWPSANDANRGEVFERTYHAPQGHLAFIRKLRSIVKLERPDIVHAHSSWAGIYARIANLDRPVVYQPHCYAFDSPHRNFVGRASIQGIERMLAPRARATVALTAHEHDLAIKLAPGAVVHQIPNISRADPAIRWTIQQQHRMIVMVGRVTAQKDPEFFAATAENVRRTHPDVHFTWIGSGDSKLTERLKDAGVRVTGWMTQREVHEIMSTAFLYLHTASYEGFPLTVIDAAAIGCPMLLRAIPAFEGTGLELVENVDDASAYIRRLLDDGGTDALREAAAKLNARSTAAEQNLAMSRAYREALEGPG